MKPQTIFNKVVRHLFKQNKKCVEAGTCSYRGKNDTQCAIGALIPKRMYDTEMENKKASTVMRDFPEFGRLIGTENSQLLNVLQETHDDADLTTRNTFKKKELKAALVAVADKYGLSTKVLLEV
jgi:hypothetical protein